MNINPENIKIEDYSYNLPNDRIAKYPLKQRDQSQLLIYNQGNITSDQFINIEQYIGSETTCVFNNTKVIQARLKFQKETGAQIEIFCLEPIEPADYVIAFQQTERIKWKCIVGNLKKWKDHNLKKIITIIDTEIELNASKISSEGNAQIIEFTWCNNKYTFSEILENIGLTPIPPYLNRESEDLDKDRYQTIYSKLKGSVAAPTAGLHFTETVLSKFRDKQIKFEEITLHVGAGTFKPVTSETIAEHEMHTEHFVVTKESIINFIKSKKIVAIGTTSVRTLESLYWLGVKLLQNKYFDSHISQWEAYKIASDINKTDSLNALIDYMANNDINELHASTQIMIYPGYIFKMVDILITNFHQPNSTLLLLIAAFIGKDWNKVYDFALTNNFRFLSYGDSSLLMPRV
ncbi:MAG: S-adenosylmethionine:tRNA ribosyltransferase-isomerase [Bacteroidales bacterium]|jgi:S-adenosylmethionine:tRNA ribosyltransferase-isomerase|nr:S-adenosylmethionine:tRNA ribosyltransferase-isomerase [Bacteroidales bacterium]